MRSKPGISLESLAKPMVNVLEKIERAYSSLKAQEWAIITSANDGHHKAGSLHYVNLAVDLRLPGGLTAKGKARDPNLVVNFAMTLRAYLGDDFDVVIEKNHIHVEYDPKVKHAA